MGKLFAELKRRNVVRVGIAYMVLGWVALQVGDILFDMFEAPVWVGKTFAGLLLLGLPFALLFAWAFEMTPEGVKKTAEVDASDSITHSTGRTLNYVIIAALVVALGYSMWSNKATDIPVDDVAVDRSIAVLPFVNMSSDKEQEWFADGLTEEILNSLARTPDLLVASRTSSFQYKGQNQDISAIATALGVAHILEGSVRRGGDRLRVTAQLIRANDGFHLWSETFDRKPKDVIAIQEDVAFEIANALKTAMDPAALKKMVSAGTASVAAYEAYLEGLALEGKFGVDGSVEDWRAALDRHERATRTDPNFAQAYYRQSLYWVDELGIANIGYGASEFTADEVMENFERTIDAAIRFAGDPTMKLRFQALKASAELRYRDAMNFAERLLAEHPYDFDGLNAVVSSAAILRDRSTAEKYLPQIQRIVSDDALTLNQLLNNMLFAGLTEEAVAMTRDAVKRFPNHAFVGYQGHRVLLWGGATDEARALIDSVRRSDFPEQNVNMMLLRQACAEGDLAAAEKYFQLLESDADDVGSRFVVNVVYGNPQKAHQLVIDANLDLQGLSSFLGYPYFDHTKFPALVAVLEPQGISPISIDGPPYTCKHPATTSP
jgi:TolB-like protein